MSTKRSNIKFLEGGIVKEIITVIQCLKKESGSEMLYTGNGDRIKVDDVISINGISFS